MGKILPLNSTTEIVLHTSDGPIILRGYAATSRGHSHGHKTQRRAPRGRDLYIEAPENVRIERLPRAKVTDEPVRGPRVAE